MYNKIKKVISAVLVTGILMSSINYFNVRAQEENSLNFNSSYYDDSPQTKNDKLMAAFIAVNANNQFVITASPQEIGVSDAVYNYKLSMLNDMNDMQSIGYLNINKDCSVDFTQKYINAIKARLPINSHAYLEKNKVCIDSGSNDGGVNQFVWNAKERRYELFCTHDTTVSIVAGIKVVGTVLSIFLMFVPYEPVVKKIASGICTLAAFAISIKNKAHGVVFLLTAPLYIPTWVCTQA